MDESIRRVEPAGVANHWSMWSGVGAAVLLIVAAGLVFSGTPEISGSDAGSRITDFYADDGKSAALVPSEFLSLAGAFLFLSFIGGLRGALQSWVPDDSRYASSAYAGGVVFAILTVAALTAHTTMAGALVFSDSLEVDPNTAILLSHLGYVLQAGAMMGAAATLFATGRAARRAAAGRRLGIASYVLGALALVSMLMVWIPFFLFLIWVGTVSLIVLRTGSDRSEWRKQ